MAIDDAPPAPVQGGAGLVNPASPLAWMIGGGDIANMSLEEIKRRRAIAMALASRNRGYPKTLGEGMTYLGEAIGDRFADERLSAAEKGYASRRDVREGAVLPPVGAAGPVAVPTTVIPRAAVPTAPLPGPTAELPPDVEEQRNRIAALYSPEGVAQQNPTEGAAQPPRGIQLASANTGTMSDAPPPGFAARPSPMPPGPAGVMPDENPPTPTDIQPMPTMVAQAGGGAPARRPGNVEIRPAPLPPAISPFDQPTPTTPPPAAGLRPIDPAVAGPIVKPKEPVYDTRPTVEEQRAAQYVREFPNDPIAQGRAAAYAKQGADRRNGANAILKENYDKDLARWEEQMKTERTRSTTFDKDAAAAAETQRKVLREREDESKFPLTRKGHYEIVKKSYDDVEKIPVAQEAITDIRKLINSDKSMFTGSDARLQLALRKWGQTFGLPIDDKTTNTEVFRGLITPILASLRPAIVGSGSQSQPEFELLRQAAAGEIKLERSSILRIMDGIEKGNRLAALRHQQQVIAHSGGLDPDQMRMYTPMMLPMEKLVPPAHVQLLRTELAKVARDPAAVKSLMDEFDRDNFTPGLAQKLLSGR